MSSTEQTTTTTSTTPDVEQAKAMIANGEKRADVLKATNITASTYTKLKAEHGEKDRSEKCATTLDAVLLVSKSHPITGSLSTYAKEHLTADAGLKLVDLDDVKDGLIVVANRARENGHGCIVVQDWAQLGSDNQTIIATLDDVRAATEIKIYMAEVRCFVGSTPWNFIQDGIRMASKVSAKMKERTEITPEMDEEIKAAYDAATSDHAQKQVAKKLAAKFGCTVKTIYNYETRMAKRAATEQA